MLAKEVSTMLSFKHTNVMSLIGVCIEGEMPLLIMPFMSNGSVLDFIRYRKIEFLITHKASQQEVYKFKSKSPQVCMYSPCRSRQLVRLYLEYVTKLQKEWSISQNVILFIVTSQQGIACKIDVYILATFIHSTLYFMMSYCYTGLMEKV